MKKSILIAALALSACAQNPGPGGATPPPQIDYVVAGYIAASTALSALEIANKITPEKAAQVRALLATTYQALQLARDTGDAKAAAAALATAQAAMP